MHRWPNGESWDTEAPTYGGEGCEDRSRDWADTREGFFPCHPGERIVLCHLSVRFLSSRTKKEQIAVTNPPQFTLLKTELLLTQAVAGRIWEKHKSCFYENIPTLVSFKPAFWKTRNLRQLSIWPLSSDHRPGGAELFSGTEVPMLWTSPNSTAPGCGNRAQ